MTDEKDEATLTAEDILEKLKPQKHHLFKAMAKLRAAKLTDTEIGIVLLMTGAELLNTQSLATPDKIAIVQSVRDIIKL